MKGRGGGRQGKHTNIEKYSRCCYVRLSDLLGNDSVKRKLKEVENILIRAGEMKTWWMLGHHSHPAPSLHLNSSGKLTILPEIPHSHALDNATPRPLNVCINTVSVLKHNVHNILFQFYPSMHEHVQSLLLQRSCCVPSGFTRGCRVNPQLWFMSQLQEDRGDTAAFWI